MHEQQSNRNYKNINDTVSAWNEKRNDNKFHAIIPLHFFDL